MVMVSCSCATKYLQKLKKNLMSQLFNMLKKNFSGVIQQLERQKKPSKHFNIDVGYNDIDSRGITSNSD